MGTLDRWEAHQDRPVANWRSRHVRFGIKFEYPQSRRNRLDSLSRPAGHFGCVDGRCAHTQSDTSLLHVRNSRPNSLSPDAVDPSMFENARNVFSTIYGLFYADD